MGNERFDQISKSTRALYTPGSPVILAAVALLKDNQAGKVLMQAKFKSVSDKAIIAVFVDVQCEDVAGAALEGVEGFQYLDLSAGHNAEFGQKTPVYLPDGRTRNIAVFVRKVMFKDGTSWDAAGNEAWEELPQPQKLYTALGTVAEQYCRDVGHNTNIDGFTPMEYQDLWFCVCGAINHEGVSRCPNTFRPHCNLEKELAFSALDRKTLYAHKQEYDEQMRLKREADAERARKQQEADEQKRKKQKKRLAIAGAAVVGYVVLCVVIGVIGKAVKYNTAVELMGKGEYAQAIEKFYSVGNYRDSKNKLQEIDALYNEIFQEFKSQSIAETVINKSIGKIAQDLTPFGDYKKAKSIIRQIDDLFTSAEEQEAQGQEADAATLFAAFGDYRDGNERAYQIAVRLLSEGKASNAVAILYILGNYKDSQEQYSSALYAIAFEDFNGQEYSAAAEGFALLGDYKDSKKNFIECLTKIGQGNSVSLGTFNGNSIEWLILQLQEDKVLLITKDILCRRAYNDSREAEWKSSSIREWLNSEFLAQSFLAEIQSLMLTGTDEGDKVFLLGRDEATTYFEGDEERATGNYWYLRTPCTSTYTDTVQYVSDNGSLSAETYGFAPNMNTAGIRPAMWISLK